MVLSCEISFQDLEKVLHLAKMYTVLKKSGNYKLAICLFRFCCWPLMTIFHMFFALCSMKKRSFFHLVLKRYWKNLWKMVF